MIASARSFVALSTSALLLCLAACGDPDTGAVEEDAGPTADARGAGGDSGGGSDASPRDEDASPDASTTDGGTTGEPRKGTPLDLTGLGAKTWKYFEIPGAACRDGSKAGIGVNLASSSKNLVIFLQGGGGCFNATTCESNPAKVSPNEVRQNDDGIFARGNAANPVADWNYVFVPYCTGDVHAGNNPSGSVPGVGAQKFVGYENMRLILGTLTATFPNTTRVLLTGSSAGGVGAAANHGQTQKAFPGVPVNMIDDSGPLLRSPALATCLQTMMTSLWKLDRTVLDECGAACKGQTDPFIAASKAFASRDPNVGKGLVSATADVTIRQFFGFGANDCTSYDGLSAAAYKAGLLDFRAQHASIPKYGVFAYESSNHTVLDKRSMYTVDVGGKTVASWVADVIADEPGQVGP